MGCKDNFLLVWSASFLKRIVFSGDINPEIENDINIVPVVPYE